MCLRRLLAFIHANVSVKMYYIDIKRVKNMRVGKQGDKFVPGQHDIARYFGDVYNGSTVNDTRSEQEEMGLLGAKRLVQHPVSVR